MCDQNRPEHGGKPARQTLSDPPAKMPPSRPDDALPAGRVLVVDDYEGSAQLLRMFLTRLGHEVHIAMDGVAGLTLAKQLTFSAAIIDVVLPRMDGLMLVRALRTLPACTNIPIVVVSGYLQDDMACHARQAGATLFLPKPVDLRRVKRIVAKRIDE